MKTSTTIKAFLLASTILHSPFSILNFTTQSAVIEQVIVRQQWPWSTDVKIEYKLSQVTNPVDIAVRAYNGTTPLDNSRIAGALSGNRYGITESGVGTIVLDPVKAFGNDKVAIADFRVELELIESTESTLEVLYKVFDLSDGSCVDITRGELLNGKYGSVETDYSKFGGNASGMPSDMLIWTGVTNDIRYATTHLVLRRIPAGSIQLGYSDGCNDKWGGIVNPTHDYEITKPFYIGVFELTRCQYKLLTTGDSWKWTAFRVYDARPMETYITYANMRGSTNGALWPTSDAVDETSVLGVLRSRTSEKFDLPTENQWEYACRAGVRKVYNNGTSNTAGLNLVGRHSGNGGQLNGATPPNDIGYTNGTMTVGGYAPNAYGLYDMHGNVAELCRDWAANDPTAFTDDTQNPTSAQSNGQRVKRGSSWYYDYRYQRAEQRAAVGVSSGDSGTGVRVMMEIATPAE